MLVVEGKVHDARHHYETALRLNPEHAIANQGLAYVLSEAGDEAAAGPHRELGFRESVTVTPYRGDGNPVRVLLLCSWLGGNIVYAQLLDHQTFETTMLVVEALADDLELPEHDVVFNAIGDADRCAAGLDVAHALLCRTRAPIVNAPEAVRKTGRVSNAERFVAASRVSSFHAPSPSPAKT